VPILQEWAREYERRFVYTCKDGTIVPKAVIGAIRGGNPYHVTRTSELCSLYLDCRLTPESDPLALRRELRELLAASKLPGTVELFLYRRSYGSGDNDILLEGLRRAHRRTIGSELQIAAPVFSSMWRDVLIFNEMGIPAITYGPPRSFRKQAMRVDDLVRAANVYAAVALEVCNREKPFTASKVTCHR
jgi:acetylornithine deacetylase/succinyl-diaminopimelate desuccinylase-like protein